MNIAISNTDDVTVQYTARIKLKFFLLVTLPSLEILAHLLQFFL